MNSLLSEYQNLSFRRVHLDEKHKLDLSILVPLYNESESLVELYEGIIRELKKTIILMKSSLLMTAVEMIPFR